jgi:hypothetical protein
LAEKVASEGLRIFAVYTPFLDVYYTDITQYITLYAPPNSPQRYDFKVLTPNDYMDMDLGSIFGLNSRFGAVLEGFGAFSALGLLTFAQQLGLSKSTGLRLPGSA